MWSPDHAATTSRGDADTLSRNHWIVETPRHTLTGAIG
ncbi:hypothetical protein I545_5987 [Mycobacterium kansasii 662]|uniref:Uncharacterized protein n=1 Tax=Mycobacterium kansasii 662 TaxID=1299326 RepID=X7YSC8_MYCKA|nr:hypothetical protein I545_5987 [Mycobacterium kansasii 662]